MSQLFMKNIWDGPNSVTTIILGIISRVRRHAGRKTMKNDPRDRHWGTATLDGPNSVTITLGIISRVRGHAGRKILKNDPRDRHWGTTTLDEPNKVPSTLDIHIQV